MANSLARLLPNLGGAGGHVRRLYAMTGTVMHSDAMHSVLLYGAPIWADKVSNSPALLRQLVGVQRLVAQRASRAFRTVSHAGATALSGIPPINLLAKSHARTYRRMQEVKNLGGVFYPGRGQC
ncbi:uncharacterized protein LOC112463489 [Temnothorax curvispinosus]|uniref:Uncharacterized protein LOC112463489 n=1 Tax=Temnothorax curvispinosus TaxID=300111 RepID=A0A6J1QT44_9HYME|nr:uncharacterized protein LOC112463489 [Temnothorax curvispinosus]